MSVIEAAAPVLGTVVDVTLRVTTVRSSDGEVVIVPNGQIVQVINLSRDWARAVIDVPIVATADVTKVSDLLQQVGLEAFDDDELHPLLPDAPTVMGVESIEVDQFEVSRALRMLITTTLSRPVSTCPPR
jgi:small-conductance mechanosensitive channel